VSGGEEGPGAGEAANPGDVAEGGAGHVGHHDPHGRGEGGAELLADLLGVAGVDLGREPHYDDAGRNGPFAYQSEHFFLTRQRGSYFSHCYAVRL
jgi:hypothetical protein